MSITAQNLEEAATIASEFVSSLDNLPSEVQHLLQEIKHKETRTQEIYQEIQKESSRYIRHALRHPATPCSPTTPNGVTTASETNSKAHLPPKIAGSYAEIDRLASEKIVLAQRVVEIVTRTRTRLDVDLARVGVLQGEVNDIAGRGGSVGAGETYILHGRNPALAISDSLRQALVVGGDGAVIGSGGGAVTVGVGSGTSGAIGQKKRRVGGQGATSIKLPSPVPPPLVSAQVTSGYGRSRQSRQTHTARNVEEELDDVDAEGEDDIEDEGGEGDDDIEDTGIYCFCQKQSYGDMIACDSGDCPYKWFHVACVNVKLPLPESEKWICSECKSRVVGRKGRKKHG